MSTQIQLYVRTEEMHDEMLRSEGYLNGGMEGVMGQLMGSGPDYFDEMMDLLTEADQYIVGNDVHDDGPSDIADIFEGVTEVTSRNISQVEAVVEDAEDLEENLIDWLEENEGEEVFAVHM